MRIASYWCEDREARAFYPTVTEPRQHIVIEYEVLPTEPEARRGLLWDGRTVIAVHKTQKRAVARVLADKGTRLRLRHSRARPLPVDDWHIVGVLTNIRVDPTADPAFARYCHRVSVAEAQRLAP